MTLHTTFPAPLSREQSAQLRRQRRGRNRALLATLLALAGLFYAMSFVKMAHQVAAHQPAALSSSS